MIVAVIMVLLVMGTNFVARCHPVEYRSSVVHLISDSCHQEDDCSHPDHDQGCRDEGCSSESCSDELALGDCLPHDSIHLQLLCRLRWWGWMSFFPFKPNRITPLCTAWRFALHRTA
jgi:hypothetical protein